MSKEMKIQTQINLFQSTKDILSKQAKQLNVNQNEIIENLIINMDSNKIILENFKYITDRENLMFEIVTQLEKNTNFNNLLLSKIEEQNIKINSFDKSIKSSTKSLKKYLTTIKNLEEIFNNSI